MIIKKTAVLVYLDALASEPLTLPQRASVEALIVPLTASVSLSDVIEMMVANADLRVLGTNLARAYALSQGYGWVFDLPVAELVLA